MTTTTADLPPVTVKAPRRQQPSSEAGWTPRGATNRPSATARPTEGGTPAHPVKELHCATTIRRETPRCHHPSGPSGLGRGGALRRRCSGGRSGGGLGFGAPNCLGRGRRGGRGHFPKSWDLPICPAHPSIRVVN
jgi:hypothetical protein